MSDELAADMVRRKGGEGSRRIRASARGSAGSLVDAALSTRRPSSRGSGRRNRPSTTATTMNKTALTA